MTLFPVEAKDFQFVVEMRVEKQSTKLIRSPCVSSTFVMIMRRTCIVLMRIVLVKRKLGKIKDTTPCQEKSETLGKKITQPSWKNTTLLLKKHKPLGKTQPTGEKTCERKNLDNK